MKPDVIVTWPWTCDYPLWRKFIRDERERFAKVLVVFTTNTRGPLDYRAFVRDQIGDIAECFDSPDPGSRDWRDVAVNAALDRSDAEWVWFTEQDFFVKDPARFWGSVIGHELNGNAAAIGFWDTVGRWHPASLFVSRRAIDQTPRYFGPEPNDHFVTFTRNFRAYIGALPSDSFEHLAGLSYNHELVDRGQTVTYNPDRFHEYLRDCLRSGVPLHPEWQRRAEREIGVSV